MYSKVSSNSPRGADRVVVETTLPEWFPTRAEDLQRLVDGEFEALHHVRDGGLVVRENDGVQVIGHQAITAQSERPPFVKPAECRRDRECLQAPGSAEHAKGSD